MIVTLDHSLQSLGAALTRYVEVRKKSPEESLVKKGRDLAINLADGFRWAWGGHVNQRRGIGQSVLDRNWAIKRIPRKAVELARTYMSDHSQIVGSMVTSPESGVIDIRSARIGKSGKRITGGRRGRGGRAASLDEYYGVDFEEREGEHVLGKRQVQVYFAVMLRLRGVGWTAASWLPRAWKKNQPAVAFTLTNTNPKAEQTVLGQVRHTISADGALLVLNSKTAAGKFPTILGAAVNKTTADITAYLLQREQQRLARAEVAR